MPLSLRLLLPPLVLATLLVASLAEIRPADARSADAQRALSTALSLLDQGLPDAALAQLRTARAAGPGDLDIEREYVDLMVAEGFGAEVLADTAARRKARPEDADAIYAHGRVLAVAGDLEGARTAFSAALKLVRTHHWSLQGLASLALLEGRDADALQLLKSAAAVAPSRDDIQNKLAAVLARSGDLPGAYAAWQKASEIAPNERTAWLNWGATLSREGKHEEAARKLETAVGKAPGYPLAHVNLAYVYARLGRYTEAVGHFETALAVNPRNATVSASRDLVQGIAVGTYPKTAFAPLAAGLEAESTDPKLAAQKYRELLALTPKFGAGHMRLGLVLAAQGDGPGALAAVQKAAELNPKDAGVRYNLGYLLLGLDRAPEARPHLEAARSLDPKDPDAVTALALVALSERDAGEALRLFGEALVLNPNDATLWVQLGTTRAAAGDFGGGITAIKKALEIAPGFLAARAQLVAILREGKRYDEALAELKKLEADAPGNPTIAAERSNIEAARTAQNKARVGGVRLRQILLLDEASAQAALSELERGTDFITVARTRGKGSESVREGDVGWVNPKDLRPEVSKAVAALSPGQRSGLIAVGGAFLIVLRVE